MPTPLPRRVPITTLKGYGFLREAPQNRPLFQRRGSASLRKCMYLPAALPEMIAAMPPWTLQPSPLQPALVRARRDVNLDLAPPKRRDPRRDVAIFSAVPSPASAAPVAAIPSGASSAIAFDAPVVAGLLLFLLPPVGLAIVWTSARYARDARWALTAASLGTMLAAVFLMR